MGGRGRRRGQWSTATELGDSSLDPDVLAGSALRPGNGTPRTAAATPAPEGDPPAGLAGSGPRLGGDAGIVGLPMKG